MICPSCGHKNVNESAPFCGGCGRPVLVVPAPAEVPAAAAAPEVPSTAGSLRCPACGYNNVAKIPAFCRGCGEPLISQFEPSTVRKLPPESRQDSPPIAPLSDAETGPPIHKRRPRWPSAAAVLCVFVIAAVSVGLALWYRRSLPVAHRSEPAINRAPAQHRPELTTTPAPVEHRPEPTTTPALVEHHPGPAPEPASRPVSGTTPAGTNIAAADLGGEIEGITGTCGPGHNGRFLNDGLPEPVWKPDSDVTFPTEIVFSFYKRDAALVSAVVITLPKDSSGPKDVEISTSMDSATEGFSKVAMAALNANVPVQAIPFSPVQARYVKINILSGAQNKMLGVGEIQVIEGSQPAYVSLAVRHPEIPAWKQSVRHAAQTGIDWLQPASIDWQKKNNCFGCHVQAQTLMGLSVARKNHYVVSPGCVRDLVEFMRTKQDVDGHEKDEGSDKRATATQFAAMGFAYFDEVTGGKKDETFLRLVDWLVHRSKPTGELVPDMNEPPISQGSLMPSANALVAFKQAFAETGDARYQQAANRSLSFITSAKPTTTQDKIFKVLALSRFGTPQERQLVAPLIRQLRSEQSADGGWKETVNMHGSNALATGQGLYALQEAGVSPDSPEFTIGVRYLLKTQTDTGSWPASNTQSGRPSEFAPTMWAVIGLAGEVESPTAESLKAALDENGRVALYINFDFDQATLRPDAKPLIVQVLKLLQDNPDLKLSLEGHTDNVGLHDYNVKLSQRRAAAVMNTLVVAGIRSDRLSSNGFGPDQPISDNSTESGRAKNRRVDLIKR